jgi:DNA methylase
LSKHYNLVIDPEFARLLIPLSPDERDLLEKSLLRDGCRDALVAWLENGTLILLDGHNRLEICTRLGIAYTVVTIKTASREMARIWVRKNQLGRRNVSDDARAMLGARLLKDLSKLARERQLAEARQSKADKRTGKKVSVSTTPVDTETKKAKVDNLAEVARQGGFSQRRLRLAQALETKAVDVVGWDAAQKICDEIGRGRLSLARAKRDLFKAEAAKKLAAAKAVVRPPLETCDLRVCSMQELLAKARGIDCILTDPPYGKEYVGVGLYGELARLAKAALKPTGTLAVMCGQYYLPEILAAMSKHIRYRWQMAYLTPGPATAIWESGNVNSQFKPILVFGGEKRIVDDVVRSDAEDKSFHEWGQSESGMMRLVERLTDPSQLIADPFLGAGTTAVAAIRLHRRVIGCDLDPDIVQKALARVALATRLN